MEDEKPDDSPIGHSDPPRWVRVGRWSRRFVVELYRSGILAPLAKIAGCFAVLAVFMYGIAWIGNPYLDKTSEPHEATPSWMSPPPVESTIPEPPLPPGIPYMDFPPKMAEVPEGEIQSVPTRYGLSYSVPNGDGWRPTNDMIVGWTNNGKTIATYGSSSDYEYGYCPESDGSAMAKVGVRGRNGIDTETAAREEVTKAEIIFSDDAGNKPKADILGPTSLDIDGRPAVHYTVIVSDIPQEESCDPPGAHFDIVATPAYASAEVMVLMIMHYTDIPKALDRRDVNKIINSLGKTE